MKQERKVRRENRKTCVIEENRKKTKKIKKVWSIILTKTEQ